MRRITTKTLRTMAAALSMSMAASTISAQSQEQVTLKIGSEGAYPPYNFVQADGNVAGFEIDIANALCAELKVKCEFVLQDWDGMIPALQTGKLDAVISSMSITPARQEQIDFSTKYYNTPAAIVALKDSGINGITKQDLAGKTIGAQSSTIHANYSELTYPDSTIKPYSNADEYRLDLVNGRLDAANDDSVTLIEWLKTEDGACCKLVGTIAPVAEIHGPGVGVAVRKGREELVERFNTAIGNIRANGKYKEINDKYFDFDVFGG